MKNSKIFIIIIFILVIMLCLLSFKFLSINKELNNSKSIYCVMNDNGSNKMEIYFDFKNGMVYRYSIICTNKYNKNINVEIYKETIDKFNNKYKGAIQKFWTDNNIYITTEIYDLELLTENEFKEITGISLKELKSKTRQQIIDSFVPMLDGGSFKCN